MDQSKLKSILQPPPKGHPQKITNGETTVEFNRYTVIYSNNLDCELKSPYRAGMTLIGCYQDTKFVGLIAFYPDGSSMPPSHLDPSGVVYLSYPLSSFPGVLATLHETKPLSLLLVENDEQGKELNPHLGAVAAGI